MEGAYRHAYLENQKKQANAYDLGRFDRKGKSAEKELEFFKGIASQAKNIENQIMSQGYDTNSITKLEELLATFQSLYNNYAQEKIRNPATGASEGMRIIMDQLKTVLNNIQQAAPQYAQRVQEHLKELNNMYVRTGGAKHNMSGGSMGRYTDQVPVDTYYHEPTLAERMAMDRNIPLYEDHKYHKMTMNSDYN